MYSAYLNYLSNYINNFKDFLSSKLTLLKDLKIYKTNSLYCYNLSLGFSRVNPYKLIKTPIESYTSTYNILINLSSLNFKFFMMIALIKKLEDFSEPHFFFRYFIFLFIIRQLIQYIIYNMLYNLVLSKFFIQESQICFRINPCQCKQNVLLKSLIISPIFFITSFLFIITIEKLTKPPLGFILNSHFSGYWLLESYLANAGLCSECRYNWLAKRNFFCLGLGLSYSINLNIFNKLFSSLNILHPFNNLIVNNFLWTFFVLLTHLNEATLGKNENFSLDIYLFPRKLSLFFIEYLKKIININFIKDNNPISSQLYQFYKITPVYFLVNTILIEEFRNSYLFIHTPPVQSLIVAYKLEAIHCLAWFAWLQGWYNSKTVRLAKCLIDVKKVFSEYFPKTLVSILISLMKLKYFNRDRLKQWKQIIDSAVIDKTLMNKIQIYLFCLEKRIATAPPQKQQINIKDDYFKINPKRELFLPAFQEEREKNYVFTNATNGKNLKIIDIRLFNQENPVKSKPQDPDQNNSGNRAPSKSLLNWGYEPQI